MSKPSVFATTLANRLEESLQAIGTLSQLLLNNGGYKGEPDDIDIAPQIDIAGEAGIQSAIQIIAGMAHRDLCELASDLEIPQ